MPKPVMFWFATTLLANASVWAQPMIEGCPILPADNVWNTPVDTLPVHPNSDTFVQTIGADRPVHPDFGSGEFAGAPIGIPFVVVDNTQTGVNVTFQFDDESDPGPYPIPPDAPIEGGPSASGDRHVLVINRDTCVLYEVFAAFPQVDGSWTGGSGAIFDLRSNELRPATFTSADAAGLPILPGLARYEEVAAGEINHALRFTVPQTKREFIWPARHFASSLTEDNFPPMGLRFRLKADVDISGFSEQAQIIMQALKTYGMILADNGSSWFLSGAPNEGWDNNALRDLRQLSGSDFEAVDQSSLIVDENSGQARQASSVTFSIIGEASGGSQNLSLNVNLTVADSDNGLSGVYYLVAVVGNQLFINNSGNWQLYDGSNVPAFMSGTLVSQSFSIFSGIDLSVLAGTQIFFGYGVDLADMLNNTKFNLVHTI